MNPVYDAKMFDARHRIILLVEDNKDDADLTLMALQDNRIKSPVVHVKDGAEAIDYLFRQGQHAARDPAAAPQVVLLDLKLPRIDGLEVLRRIRQAPETKSLPVVILTTSREDEDLACAYGCGANSYIQKPVDFGKFTEAVKQLSLYWLELNECAPAQYPRSGREA